MVTGCHDDSNAVTQGWAVAINQAELALIGRIGLILIAFYRRNEVQSSL
jgi:hypothetical protein